MIYVTLDTNIWIYLANSLDPATNNLQEGFHFKLFEKLSSKVSEGVITILVSDLLESEWTRNQSKCLALISRYENKLENDLQTIRRINNALKNEFQDNCITLEEAYSNHINLQIDENKQHVENVKQFLSSSIKFETSIEVKGFAADWSVAKKAPFIGDKQNSMADALLLFSAIDYAKKIRSGESEGKNDTPFVFVSANKNDFCSKKSNNKIHDDLKELVEEVGIKFFISLPEALNFIDDTLFDEIEVRVMSEDMDEFISRRFPCLYCSEDTDHDGLNFVEFEQKEEVLDTTIPYVDPSQLSLTFGGEFKSKKTVKATIQRGYCLFCDTEHIKCHCGKVTIVDFFGNGFECEQCGIAYVKEKPPMGERKDFNYKIVDLEELDDQLYGDAG
jgi:hypothetical protein